LFTGRFDGWFALLSSVRSLLRDPHGFFFFLSLSNWILSPPLLSLYLLTRGTESFSPLDRAPPSPGGKSIFDLLKYGSGILSTSFLRAIIWPPPPPLVIQLWLAFLPLVLIFQDPRPPQVELPLCRYLPFLWNRRRPSPS